MIYNARRLIKSLRKIVDSDTDSIWIDYRNNSFQKVHDASTPDASRAFPKNEPSVQGLLKYLEDEGYIIFEHDHEYFSLTYKALYYRQIVVHEKLRYLLQSILVPIILSVITSILTTTFLPELLSTLLQKIL